MGGGGTTRHSEGGGGTTSLEVVLTQELEVSHTVGGAKSFHPMKGGGVKKNTLSRGEGGGGRKKLHTNDFPIL